MVVFDYYIADQSPAISYAPYRDGPTAGGWNSTYSLQDQVTWTQNTLGPGYSSHTTAFPSASATLNFTGTTVYALGNASNMNQYTVLCDGKDTAIKSGYDQGILGCCTNMTLGPHSVKFISNTTETLALLGFHIWTTFNSTQGATTSNHSVKAAPPGSRKRTLEELGAAWYLPLAGETADDVIEAVLADRKEARIRKRSQAGTLARRANYGDSSWQTTGEWNVNSKIGGGADGTNATKYPRVETNAPTSVLILTVPKNSSFAAIVGAVDWNHGTFQIQAWPDEDHSLASDWATFNSSSRWASTEQIKCIADFNPKRSWEIAVTNMGPSPLAYWDIASLFYVQTSDVSTSDQGNSNGTPTSNKLSTGAIVGIAIGAVAGVAVVIILGFLFFRRRKSKRVVRTAGVADLGDEDKGERVMPFRPDMAQVGSSSSGHDSTLPMLTPGLGAMATAEGSRSSGSDPSYPRHSSKSGALLSPSGISGSNDMTSPSVSGSRPESTSGYSNHQLATALAVPSTSASESKHLRSPRVAPPQPAVRQERDAGRVAEAEVIPPEYNPEWAEHQEPRQ